MPDLPPGQDYDLLSEAFFRERSVADASAQAQAPRSGGGRRRRLLLRLGFVALLLALIDLLVRRELPAEDLLPYTLGEESTYTIKVQRFESAPAPDVVFLGSSRVRDGVVPQVFSDRLAAELHRPVRVYNLGLVNAKVEEWLTIVRRHLPDPPPPYVVLGITGSEVVKVHNFQYASRFLWRLPDMLDWLRRVPRSEFDPAHIEYYIEQELCRAWYVFAHRDALREWLLDQARSRWGLMPLTADEIATRAEWADKVKRFVLSPDGYAPPTDESTYTLERHLREHPESIRVLSRELERPAEMVDGGEFPEVRAIAAELARRGSRLALVEMPVSPYLQHLNPVLHGPVFRQRMADLAADIGCVWVPMPEEDTLLGNRAYLDVNHLSWKGARVYTRTLFDRLQKCGYFQGGGQ